MSEFHYNVNSLSLSSLHVATDDDCETCRRDGESESHRDLSIDRNVQFTDSTINSTATGGRRQDSAFNFACSAGFLESWSNVDGGDFLGVSGTNCFTRSSHNLRQTSTSSLPTYPTNTFGGFGMIDPATFSRNLSSPSGPRKDHMGVSSIIHDAARLTDWDMVLELCRSHPEAAAYSGHEDGWTALHQACNRRCPRVDVMEALIQAYPAALLQEESGKNWLPLHLACRFKAPKEVVRLLLHMYPESGRIAVEARDRQGRRPLYYAIRYEAPNGVAGLLLHVDPTAVLEEDQNEDSPLALVWDSWAEKLEGKRIVHSFLPGGFPEPNESTVEQRAVLLRERLKKEVKLKKRWDQVNTLLKAAFGFPFEDPVLGSDELSNDLGETEKRTWRVVHATAATKCHLSLFRLACALHPEQARELDNFDLRRPTAGTITLNTANNCNSHQTALHLAASSNASGEVGKQILVSLLSLNREAAQAQDGIDGSLPLHRMVENQHKDWPNYCAILYPFYPRAVQISDHNGKRPLHRAANTKSHYTVESDEERSVIIQLVRLYPQAAGIADTSGCLPLHYSSMHAKMWDDQVEAIFNANRSAVHVRAGREWDDRLPIHFAAANESASESLIQRLIQLHPRGAAQEDHQGRLPLHYACELGKDWAAGTRYIYDAFPNAIRISERNSRGWLPLHMAAAFKGKNGSLISKLVELHPEAAFVPDHEGNYPFHLACCSGKDWEGGLKDLFNANPNALSSQDSRGFLPFHICALSMCKKDTHKSKTRAVPIVQEKQEITVVHEEAAQLDILFNLIRSDPTTIQ